MLLLLACVATPDSGTPVTQDTATMEDSGAPLDTSVTEIPGDTAPEPTEDPDDPALPFGLARIHTVDLTLSDAAVRALHDDPYTWVEGDVVLDGEALPQIGVRLKGNSSYQDIRKKPALKLDLDRYLPDQDFHGLSKLTLNNFAGDPSKLHEVLAYAAFAALDLPTPRVGYAAVTLNGEDYGLYLTLETPSHDWMARMIGDRDGRVYEGGNTIPGQETHADFTLDAADDFELEVGEDVANADVIAIAAEVADAGDGWMERVDPVVDLDTYVRYHLAEAYVGQNDGYVVGANNFRVIVDAEGRAQLVPSGLDYSFTERMGGDFSFGWGALSTGCASQPICSALRRAALPDVLAALDAADLAGVRANAWALIEAAALADPKAPVDPNTLDDTLADLDTWITERPDDLGALFGG